jgi:hypothetical protein
MVNVFICVSDIDIYREKGDASRETKREGRES